MENRTLANRLRDLRKKRGLLQKQVADKLDIKANTLSGYETGTRSPDPKLLNDLADLYDVTTDYLLGRSDDPRLTESQDQETNAKVKDIKSKIDKLPKDQQDRVWERLEAYVDGMTHADEDKN